MEAHLGPGETLEPGTAPAIDALLSDPEVFAVLVPLVPRGTGLLPRAARRYLSAWDGRFLHAQTWFAPAARVVARERLAGFRHGDAAPALADALEKGRRVEALRGGAVGCDLARDLSAWSAHWRAEGEAWGRAAARDARLLPFATTRGHLLRPHRRVVEALQAQVGAPGLLLHWTREAAWAGGCEAALRPRPPAF